MMYVVITVSYKNVMKVLKNNQLILGVVGLMIVSAGYLNFLNKEEMIQISEIVETSIADNVEEKSEDSIGDATLVSTVPVEEEKEETIQEDTTDEYFTVSRLEREAQFSHSIETYQNIISTATVTEAQRLAAQTEIDKINAIKNAIMISENLLKIKGIEDLIIFVNNDSINVVLKEADNTESTTTQLIAQVQNIVSREFNAEITNIHITTKE